MSNLWTSGPTIRPQVPPASSLTGDLLQEIFDQSARLRTTLKMLRQSDASRHFKHLPDSGNLELLLEQLKTHVKRARYLSGPAAVEREAYPDQAWVAKLKILASGNQAVSLTEAAACVRHALQVTSEVADRLQRLYELGKTNGWPTPTLSLLKTAILLADDYAALTAPRQQVAKLKAELKSLEAEIAALEAA